MKVLVFLITSFAFVISTNQRLYQLQKAPLKGDGSKSFAHFLSHFEKSDATLEIDHAKITAYKKVFLKENLNRSAYAKKYINDLKAFIPELVNGNFSRVGPPIVKPLNRFYPDENTIAVTYLTRHHFNTTGFMVRLALFDLKGNHISKSIGEKHNLKRSTIIAGLDIEETTLCFFTYPNIINSTTYKNIWEKDIAQNGIQNNNISNYEKIETNLLAIQSDGILDVKNEKASLASLK